MANSNRPTGHNRKVTGKASGVGKRGDGLGNSGPVGGSSSFGGSGKPGGSFKVEPGGSGDGTIRSSGSKLPLLAILLVLALGGGGSSIFSSLLGSDSSVDSNTYQTTTQSTSQTTSTSATSTYGSMDLSSLASLFGSTTAGSITSSGGSWADGDNTGTLNRNVSTSAREKYTTIKGDGSDVITLMIYMCGTDLESQNAMASSDLQEILAAKTNNENLNILIYTGGCKRWQNNVISNTVNQIYKIENGNLKLLEENEGTGAMTKVDTLVSFIDYCKTNYPANRNQLIFWDHGGGSVSGYGYDEKYPTSGSMDLSGIQDALKQANVKFDFIGFDACLMATAETALALDPYADYLIASEETEPGKGWYYTNWVAALANNTSMDTLDLGQNIIDDFITVTGSACRGQSLTLSIVDLSELSQTLPTKLTDFAKSTKELITNKEYTTISTARNGAREFARSSRIDQVDLVHMATLLDTEESNAMADVIKEAVKYNRTSSDMTNSYGLSIYFPYKSLRTVDTAINLYNQIGMDDEYTSAVRQCATMVASGQISSGGSSTSSPLGSLLGTGYSSTSSSSDMMTQLLGSLLTGSVSGLSGFTSDRAVFVTESELDEETITANLENSTFDADKLIWNVNDDGQYTMSLSEDQWSLVSELDLNMYYDDGEGYMNLGLDNVFEFDDEGNLIGDNSPVWMAIDGQIVSYFHEYTTNVDGEYKIIGYVPAILNGEDYIKIIIIFDNENEDGYVAGYRYDYKDDETETLAKGADEFEDGDTIDFICDYYDYEGNFVDSYMMGEQITVSGDLGVTYLELDDNIKACYRFTDLYGQYYFTPVME